MRRFLINVGLDQSGAGLPSGWNNISPTLPSSGELWDYLESTEGRITYSVSPAWGGVMPNTNGTTANTLYPALATSVSIYVSTTAFGGTPTSYTLTFGGLNPALTYNFQFFASRTGVVDVRSANYTIGATTVTLDAANNDNNTVSITGVQPSAGGGVVVTFTTGAGNTNSNGFAYLGIIDITEVGGEPPLAMSELIAQGFDVLGYMGSSTWTADKFVPGQIGIFLNNGVNTISGAVGGATTASFLPGTSASNALKGNVQADTGTKILRMMIGSNDAASGVSLADWITNINLIIADALTWPVDSVILEEIGYRTDAGAAEILVQNNARAVIAANVNNTVGSNVVFVGTAETYADQVAHPELFADSVHQTGPASDPSTGSYRLALYQAMELGYSPATGDADTARTVLNLLALGAL